MPIAKCQLLADVIKPFFSSRLFEVGIINKFMVKGLLPLEAISKPPREKNTLERVKLDQMVLMLAFLLTGLALAMITFAIELGYMRKEK